MMSGEEMDQLRREVKTLRSNEKILRRMISTMEEMNQLLRRQSSKCYCSHSADTKLKTKLSVLNNKFNNFKSSLELNSIDKSVADLVVIKTDSKKYLEQKSWSEIVVSAEEEKSQQTVINVNSDEYFPEEDIEVIERLNEMDETVMVSVDGIETEEDNESNEADTEYCCEFSDSKSGLLCQKKFTSKESLLNHVIGHSGQKPWFCDVNDCEYRAFHRNHLIGHIRKSHTGRHQFKCDWPGCDFKGPSRYNVKRHYTMHTKEKPYKCDWPGCEFRSPNNKIAEHKRIHTGEKPYTCAWVGCDARFSRAFTLKNHLRTHTGEKPFKCDFPNCAYSSKQQTPLATHKRKHHNQQSVTNAFSEVVIAEEVTDNIVATDE